MKGQNTFSEEPATPEQILAIFQDWQRLEWGKSLGAGQSLAFDTTVRAWRDDCELQGWQQLGEALNKFFGTKFSTDDWQGAMKPEKQKTLREVCGLIATHATLPKVGDQIAFGRLCKSASAFFALRFSLERAGVSIAGLRPSTKLDGLLRKHNQTIVESVIKLAPGRLPLMTTKVNLGHKLSGWACLAGLMTLVVGGVLEEPYLTAAGCLTLLLGFVAITLFSNLPPARVRLEGMETFGDLCRLVAGVERQAAKP